MTRPVLTIEEAAMLFGVGTNTAYDAVKSGDIPSVTLGRRRVVPTAPALRMLGFRVPVVEAAVERRS